jgi:hypothetical protein
MLNEDGNRTKAKDDKRHDVHVRVSMEAAAAIGWNLNNWMMGAQNGRR